MINGYAEIATVIYILGCIAWPFLWHFASGFGLFAGNRLLYFPFLVVPVIFLIEIFLIWWQPALGTFQSEQDLIQVIERNNSQLLTAIFGVLILKVALLNVKAIGTLSKNFLFFIALALICSVAGVLVLYWIPGQNLTSYYLLRHLKTIPYTYAIGFFLSGLLILINEILSAEHSLIDSSGSLDKKV